MVKKYQTHPEYKKMKYILKEKFDELELPDEAKEIINGLLTSEQNVEAQEQACIDFCKRQDIEGIVLIWLILISPLLGVFNSKRGRLI